MKKWELYERYLKHEGNITPEDLVLDYSDNYRNAAVREDIQPIINRLEKAKSDYFNSLFDLYEKDVEYGRIDSKIRDIARVTKIDGVYRSIKPIVDFGDISTITMPDINGAHKSAFEGREFPRSVKREKGEIN